jgi:hypothetical protein
MTELAGLQRQPRHVDLLASCQRSPALPLAESESLAQ